MDLYCQRCGEPWDTDYVRHEMDAEDGPGARQRFIRGEGCPACRWGRTAPAETPEAAEAARAVMALSGDDLDGAAADLDDFLALF